MMLKTKVVNAYIVFKGIVHPKHTINLDLVDIEGSTATIWGIGGLLKKVTDRDTKCTHRKKQH